MKKNRVLFLGAVLIVQVSSEDKTDYPRKLKEKIYQSFGLDKVTLHEPSITEQLRRQEEKNIVYREGKEEKEKRPLIVLSDRPNEKAWTLFLKEVEVLPTGYTIALFYNPKKHLYHKLIVRSWNFHTVIKNIRNHALKVHSEVVALRIKYPDF